MAKIVGVVVTVLGIVIVLSIVSLVVIVLTIQSLVLLTVYQNFQEISQTRVLFDGSNVWVYTALKRVVSFKKIQKF